MKITKIDLQGFRAFDESFGLDLEGGKNLLLHGENGSGKSSIYLALKRFFEECCDDIGSHRNLFSPETRNSYVRVYIKGTDAEGESHDVACNWCDADGHPLAIPDDPAAATISPKLRSILVDGSRRAGFLDYRAMLRTNLLAAPLSRSSKGPRIHDAIYGVETAGLGEQLFDLVTLVVLSGVRVTTAGGSESTVGELMRDVWANRPITRHAHDLDLANIHANAFNQAFNAILDEMQTKLAEFLTYFENHQLTITFQPVSLAWDKGTLALVGAELIPEITFRELILTNHHQFLNEARLSALATCLFLAGVVLSDNDYDNPTHPRFLVLDDALIGLDLQNRLPFLRILTSDAFKNYQIFLLTYDRVWFDLARGHLHDKNRWTHQELLADEDTGHLVPHPKASKSDLEIGKKHLASGDLKAAAVYARSAFEWKLRNVCKDRSIKIAFKLDAKRISANALWSGILQCQKERGKQRAKDATVPEFISAALISDVETVRSNVLNKLSHAGSSSLVSGEVAAAIEIIQRLIDHDFPRAR